jgi:hypothetical protein
VRVVRDYVRRLSYDRRDPAGREDDHDFDAYPVNMIYNGEIPEAMPICDAMDLDRGQTDEPEDALLCFAVYRITPKRGIPWDIVEAFDNRLRSETLENLLWASGYTGDNAPGGRKFMNFWQQYLTPEQAKSFEEDPAVSYSLVPSEIRGCLRSTGVACKTATGTW